MPGDDTLTVDTSTSFSAGDELLLSATEFGSNENEKVFVVSQTGGVITLNDTVSHFHYGSNSETLNTRVGDLDMRAWVVKLNRNVRIEKDDIDWGCRVLTTKYTNYDLNKRWDGSTILDQV